MRLGLNLGYWGMGNNASNLAYAREADELGYSVVWAAEAYGSDAATVLAFMAAQTTRIDIGAAVFQIPARQPTMTAMTAATLDSLSGGRFRLGLGVSGPQVSEGWYGVPFSAPIGRTREYIEIVNLALRREPVVYSGKHYTLPIPDGPGKKLNLIIHPVRDKVPIYLGSLGPQNLRLTGEIADGWLGLFADPEALGPVLATIAEGRAKVGNTMDGFDVSPTLPLVVGDDLAACADVTRRQTALYIGGMGSRDKNFYNDLACRMGYEAEAAAVQEHYLAKRYQEAEAALPQELLERIGLLGTVDRIADRMREYAEAGVTTINVALYHQGGPGGQSVLRTAVEALEKSGVGE
ncbi:MAG TPA: LLM class F420-dependent oxidoreductase [Sporichthya sp.]|nr:LLM class F420-dependent oxidoreductase [Sporichthya sp.]